MKRHFCSICGKMAFGKKFCQTCYHKIPKIRKNPKDLFFTHVNKSQDGCWLWKASKNCPRGYGAFWLNGKRILAHRVSWILANGPIPKGLKVLHHCDNRMCVNPKCLFLGTQNDNMKDASSKGRLQHGQQKYNAKITDKDVLKIRKLFHEKGISSTKIAEMFKINESNAWRIANHQAWKHIP